MFRFSAASLDGQVNHYTRPGNDCYKKLLKMAIDS